jgi:hypothetical protein
MPRTEEGLYQALEEELKKSKEPLSCAELFDHNTVREHAASINRVSDYLGNMWRKGLVNRLPAPLGGNTRARWLYVWKGKKSPPKPDVSEAVEDFMTKRVLVQKPSLEISEAGNNITIELPNLVITIKAR